MRYMFLFSIVLVVAPAMAWAQDDADTARATALAKELLDHGATLFDKRDAATMAATYVDGAEIRLIKRSSDSGLIETDVRQGRAAIEEAYAKIFKDRKPEHKSRNTVESARFLNTDLLLIQGRFALDRDQRDTIQFVQIRARENDKWKIASMQLMELPAR